MVDRRVDLDRLGDVVADVSDGIERLVAETTPTASEFWLPNGLPIAATGSPTTTRDESPSGTGRARGLRVDLDHAHVVEEVPADDLRRHPVAVPELDVDLGRRRAVVGVALARRS